MLQQLSGSWVHLKAGFNPTGLCFQDTGLHYDRYLREVMEYLEEDPKFKEKLLNANMDDIKVKCCSFGPSRPNGVLTLDSCLQNGKLSKELDFVHHSLRTKLDELKREEMNRLRMLLKAKYDLENGKGK